MFEGDRVLKVNTCDEELIVPARRIYRFVCKFGDPLVDGEGDDG